MAGTVSLRPRVDSDLDDLYRLAADLDSWEERNLLPPAPLTRPAWDARLARQDEGRGGDCPFVIDVDGACAGGCTLMSIDPLAHHGECGISLRPEFRGQGVGTAALTQLVEFGFLRRNLRRLHLGVISSNLGAIRVYEKVGFRDEGVLREHVWNRGAWEDEIRMGLLRSEWTGWGDRAR